MLESQIKQLEEEAANEMLIPIEVDADVFDKVKQNLFPSFEGLSPIHYLGLLGGTTKAQRPEEKDLFFDDTYRWNVIEPFVFMTEAEKQAAIDAVNKLLAPDQPTAAEIMAEASKANPEDSAALNKLSKVVNSDKRAALVIDIDKLRTLLQEQQANLGLSDIQVAYALHHAALAKRENASKSRDALSFIFNLKREAKLGDIHPELRLAGLVPSSHFLLDRQPSLHIAGNFKNLPADATKAKLDKVTFATREFVAPTAYRAPEGAVLEHPIFKKSFQEMLVDFPYHERSELEHPNNPRELVVDMKVWKLFNYIFPNLKTPESRMAFMEHFDISPGERTLVRLPVLVSQA